MTQKISIVQLPNTEGLKIDSLEHPVTALRSTFEPGNLPFEIDLYLNNPGHYGLSNRQLYLAGHIKLLIEQESSGKTADNITISEAEADMALAGHLLSQARVLRHIMGSFTTWLKSDPAVNWEAEAIGWFKAVMDKGISVPEDYKDSLDLIRQHMCISLTNNYGDERYPDLVEQAEQYLDEREIQFDRPRYVDLTSDGSYRISPLISLKTSELVKLYHWALEIRKKVTARPVKAFPEPITVKVEYPGGAWMFLMISSDSQADWVTLETFTSVDGSSFWAMAPSDAKAFAEHITELLVEEVSIESTKAKAVAPKVGAAELFMESSD